MTFSLVLAALLCFTAWMSVVQATHAPVVSCCPGWSTTKIDPKRIQSYSFQTEAECRIKAVVFQGKKGKRICSNPDDECTKIAILKVDEEKRRQKALQEKGQNEEESTTNITPAVSLPLKTNPQKKGRKGRKRYRGLKKCVRNH
ncbi:monocyte chemotactic protein 1B-like [Cebidichthys violaceus]|uniref:monocyte chemotactic protein 1B-like n=1 Tax=Cebidichthys violaceus TaxID=271503 RepID=UPI0035C9BDFD